MPETKPGGYEHLYWTFCLHCNGPLFGMQEQCHQTKLIWECGICGARNVFSDSYQPVAIAESVSLKSRPSSCTSDM